MLSRLLTRLSVAHSVSVAYTTPYLVHNNQYIFQTISMGGEQYTTQTSNPPMLMPSCCESVHDIYAKCSGCPKNKGGIITTKNMLADS
ncbi:hypothetical protein DER45DRAFT_24927 [Fusarium avenaceum]|nr:hypothetical protein DER45DRAFT_24927 [Fusarium avenaceum]